MIISNEKKFIFVHIPRTGGFSLGYLLSGNMLPKTARRHKHHDKLCDIHKDQLDHPVEDYKIVTFVRNPFDRLVSLWASAWNTSKLPFPEFLYGLEERNHRDVYSLSQRWWAGGCGNFDFVGRYENYEEDVRALLDLLDIEQPATLPHKHRREHPPYREVYEADPTGDLRRYVEANCQWDRRKFDYSY